MCSPVLEVIEADGCVTGVLCFIKKMHLRGCLRIKLEEDDLTLLRSNK